MVVVPVAVMTLTWRTPRDRACSSVYQTSKAPLATSNLAATSTSLSLNVMLVSGLLLVNG